MWKSISRCTVPKLLLSALGTVYLVQICCIWKRGGSHILIFQPSQGGYQKKWAVDQTLLHVQESDSARLKQIRVIPLGMKKYLLHDSSGGCSIGC